MSAVGFVGAGPQPSGSVARPLNSDAIFRIEVSLSSRRSTVIVMKCTARLYSLESMKSSEDSANQGDSEWKSVAYGVPCIQITRETTEHNSPFSIKIVVAEIESGIALWSCVLARGCKYHAMQNNFHTLSVKGKPHAIQFANEDEAVRFLESVEDLLYQKEKSETVTFDKVKSDDAIFRKPKSQKKLTKKDISAPCNFKHVSGITVQRTRTCEDELRGTIQRKIRSMSLSNLTGRKKPRPQTEVAMGASSERLGPQESSSVVNGGAIKYGNGPLKATKSFRNRFGSLTRPKKKQHTSLTVTELSNGPLPKDPASSFIRNTDGRLSLPTRGHNQQRPAVTSDTFVPFGEDSRLSPTRKLSMSSGDLVFSGRAQSQVATPTPAAPATSNSGTGTQGEPHPSMVERRHTMSTQRNGGGNGYSYTPYSKCAEKISKRRSATMDTKTNSHQLAATPNHTPQQSLGQFGRQYSSDMSLHRNTGSQDTRGNVGVAGCVPRSAMRVNHQQRMSYYEGQDSRSDTGSHNHSGHAPQQASNAHQFYTLDRNFRLSGGKPRQDEMLGFGRGIKAANSVEILADEGYGHLYIPKEQKVIHSSELPVGVAPPPQTLGQDVTSSFAQPPQHTDISSAHIPHWNQNVHVTTASQTNKTVPGVQQNLVSIPETASAHKVASTHSAQNSRSVMSDHYNLLNPPTRSSQYTHRPVPVAVPKVPPTFQGPRPQQLQNSGSVEHHFKPPPQILNYTRMQHLPAKRGLPGKPMTTSMATQSLHSTTHVSPSQATPYQYGNVSSSKGVSKGVNSAPVHVQPPVVPQYRQEVASGTNLAPPTHLSSHVTPSGHTPQISVENQPYNNSVHISEHDNSSSLNNSFDGNDSTTAEMLAYTEQMSKALEQFSLLTKRPSIIQTSF